jgi:polar amino acid transport system substrate-binding protein
MTRRLASFMACVTAGATILVACSSSAPHLPSAHAQSPPVMPYPVSIYHGPPNPPNPSATCADGTASLRPLGPPPAPRSFPTGSAMAQIVRRGYLLAGVDQNTFQGGYLDPAQNE